MGTDFAIYNSQQNTELQTPINKQAKNTHKKALSKNDIIFKTMMTVIKRFSSELCFL